MEITEIVVILAAGVAAGFLNIVAGGGSLLTLPILIFIGLPAAVANGTNRIGLFVETVVGVANFRKKGFFEPKYSLELALPAIAGAIIGSRLVIEIPDEIFNKILAGVMVLVMGFMILNQKTKSPVTNPSFSKSQRIMSSVAFFFVGLYGGSIQAGVGFIIIAALSFITRLSLVNINTIKIFVIGAYLIPSLAIFILNGKVNWAIGFVLAIGMGIGAWLGTHFTIKKGDKWIKVVLAIAVLAMAAKLAGVFELF